LFARVAALERSAGLHDFVLCTHHNFCCGLGGGKWGVCTNAGCGRSLIKKGHHKPRCRYCPLTPLKAEHDADDVVPNTQK